jgi:hypothetical protein
MSQIPTNAAIDALPPLLFEPTSRRIPPGLEGMDLNEMRKKARAWVGPELSLLPRHSLVMTLRQALEDDNVAERILRALPPQELAVAAVYRRYGGSVDGEVIRLDLMARGLLEIIEVPTPYHIARTWKSNPIRALTEAWALISERPDMGFYFSPYYTHGPEHSFERYSLHAGMVRSIKPAGPPPWSISPAAGIPQAATITGRSAAEVALDLSRVFAYLSAHGSVKVRKNGILATPVLRAMEKAVPLDMVADFPLPDPHSFLFELLRLAGAVRIEAGEALADPAAMTRQIDRSMNASTSRRTSGAAGRCWPGHWAAWPAPAITGTTCRASSRRSTPASGMPVRISPAGTRPGIRGFRPSWTRAVQHPIVSGRGGTDMQEPGTPTP